MSADRTALAAGLAAFLLLAPAARADCANATTQADMDSCAGADFRKADAALNRTYAEVMARLGDDAHGKQALIAAERAWLAFRDAECVFETAPAEGGSIRPMLVTICRTALTRRREAALRAMLRCPQGDLSCPVPPG